MIPLTPTPMLDDHRHLIRRLRAALRGELPGADAQALMSPRPRHGWVPGTVPPGCRQAATLLLLYPRRRRAHIVLTERREDLPDHPGQIAFPGGEVEAGESLEQAALREAHEEVGLDPDGVELIGRLTPLHIPVSRFVVHPIVGAYEGSPRLVPADHEVARVLEAPVAELADPATLECRISHHRGVVAQVPYFALGSAQVWGATAMMLAELLALLGVAPDPWDAPSPITLS